MISQWPRLTCAIREFVEMLFVIIICHACDLGRVKNSNDNSIDYIKCYLPHNSVTQ